MFIHRRKGRESHGPLTWQFSHPSQLIGCSSTLIIHGLGGVREGLGDIGGEELGDRVLSTQPWGSYHSCWVQTFQCVSFKVTQLVPVTPHALLCKWTWKLSGSQSDLSWDTRRRGGHCSCLPQGRDFSNIIQARRWDVPVEKQMHIWAAVVFCRVAVTGWCLFGSYLLCFLVKLIWGHVYVHSCHCCHCSALFLTPCWRSAVGCQANLWVTEPLEQEALARQSIAIWPT